MTIKKILKRIRSSLPNEFLWKAVLEISNNICRIGIFFEQLCSSTPGIDCKETNTSKFQRIFSDLQIAFETICFEMKMTYSGMLDRLDITTFNFLRVIVISGFSSLEIYKNL